MEEEAEQPAAADEATDPAMEAPNDQEAASAAQESSAYPSDAGGSPAMQLCTCSRSHGRVSGCTFFEDMMLHKPTRQSGAF